MNKDLHILFLTGWYPSRVSIDVGDFIQRHAEAVTQLHRVTAVHVISDKNVNQKIEITDNNINNVRTLIAYVKPSSSFFSKAWRFMKAYSLLLKKAGNFDIIHLNKLYPVGIVSVFLKLFKNKKYIISEHFHIYHKPFNKEIGYLEKKLSKIITKNASFVCPVSDNLATAMQDFGLKGNYEKVPNVVKTAVFYPKENKPNDLFTLLHVSSMDTVKNVDKIIDVIADLQKHTTDFVFYLIGKDSKKYKDYAKSLKIKPDLIKYVGLVNQEELSEYYRKADVFLLFSSIENLPCVILESFSSGTPVVSSDVGGISEYFPEKFGYLIEKGNKKQLLDRILKICSNSEKESPTKMHTYVKDNFSPMSIAKMFDKLYQSCLKQNN